MMAFVRSKRVSIFAAAASAVALFASACSTSQSSGSGSSSGSSGSGQVGYSESFLTDPFQVQLVKQLGEQAKTQNVDLLPAVNANDDAGKQSSDVQTLLSRGVKGLIVVPVDSNAISPAIAQANAKHIPVVTADLGPSKGSAKAFMIVRANNVLMGQEVCQAMGKKLHGKGTVLNLQGDLASINGQDRSNGFTQCMSKKYPGIKVISKPMKWQTPLCGTQAQTVLSTTHIDGLFMASESVCLAPVLKDLKSAGKLAKAGTKNHLVTMAIDGTPAGMQAVRNGYLDLDVSQPLNLYAKYGIYYIKAAMKGKTFAPGPDGHGGTIVKYGNSLMDLLPPVPVTAANANDKALWGNA